MDKPRFTAPQKRAFDFLPADGSWTTSRVGRSYSAALGSLHLYHKALVESAWMDGPRGGSFLSYRLKPAGVAIRAAEPQQEGGVW